MQLIKRELLKKLALRQNVTVGAGLHVGPGSVVWAPRHLQLGNDVYIGKNVTIEVDGTVGDGVLVANSVGIIGRTDHNMRQIGVSVRRSRWVGDHPEALSQPVIIGSDVWIGYGAIILSGVTIGDSAIVAAGALVTGDVEENSIVVGSPARKIGERFGETEFSEHWHVLQSKGMSRLTPRKS